MKTIFSILLILCLVGCGGYPTPILNGKDPFIVGSIEKFDDTHSWYCTENAGSGAGSSWYTHPRIILPNNFYHVGETITFPNPNIQILDTIK